ncbi:hypothetical protein ACWTU6_31675, partial [Mesorhizobium sp. BHbsci]
PLQQYLSSAELSEQAGQQGHDWPPAAPLEASAGPGDSAAGVPAADWGAIDNLENIEQALDMLPSWSPGDLLAPDEAGDGETYPQAHEHLSGHASGEQGHDWPTAAPLEDSAGPGDSAAGLPTPDWGAIDNLDNIEQALDMLP